MGLGYSPHFTDQETEVGLWMGYWKSELENDKAD